MSYNIPRNQETRKGEVMSSFVVRPGKSAERKIISISPKRQITIPRKFFTTLGFESEAECVMRGGEIVIRPVKTMSGGEFAEQILQELITAGYSGDALLAAFKERQAKIRPAVEAMLEEAETAAAGESDYVTFDAVFGDE